MRTDLVMHKSPSKIRLINILIGAMLVIYQLYSFLPPAFVNGLKVGVPTLTLLMCIRQNNGKLRNIKVIVWVYIFLIFSLLSMIGGISISYSLDRFIAMLSALVFLSALAQYVRNIEDIYKVIYYLILGSVLYLVLFSIQNFSSLVTLNFNYIQFPMEFNNIITPTFYYVIWKYFYTTEKKYLLGIIILVFLGFSIISGIKKALFFPFIFLGILLLLRNRRNIVKNIILIVIVILLMILLYNLTMSNELLYDIIGRRIEGFLNYFTGHGRVDGSTRVRMGLMEDAWRTFKENPITGVGLGAFRETTVHGVYAHNNFLELLASVGITGFLSFYWVHLSLIRTFIKRIRRNIAKELDFLLLSVLLTTLLHDVATISYYRFSYLIPVCLALCYLKLTKANKKHTL